MQGASQEDARKVSISLINSPWSNPPKSRPERKKIGQVNEETKLPEETRIKEA